MSSMIEIGQALLEKHEAYVRRHGGLLDEDVEVHLSLNDAQTTANNPTPVVGR